MEAGQIIDAIQTIYRLCGKIDYARQLRKGGEMTGKSKAFKEIDLEAKGEEN